GQPAREPGQLGGVHHADSDGVAVPEPVVLGLLDGVRERVPVVEDLPQAALLQVGRHDVRLDLDGAFDQRAGVGAVRGRGAPPAGGWKAPTRFLPSGMLMPVLPPTAASTMPSSVVGTSTARTPRSHDAAANPARSVAAPPPTPTTTSVRVIPARANADQSPARTPTSFAASPSGTGSAWTAYPADSRAPHTGRAISGSPSAWTTATVLARSPTMAGSSPMTPVPITTSYGSAPPTCTLDCVTP